MRGSGSGTMNLPRYPRSRIFGMIASPMCHESTSTCGGCRSYSVRSSTIGMCVPGVYWPIFSEPVSSQIESTSSGVTPV